MKLIIWGVRRAKQSRCELELGMIAEFVLIYRFTGFFLRSAGPIPGAGRNQEKADEEHEARPAPASYRTPEGGTSFPLGTGSSSQHQVPREGCRYAMSL